MKKSKRNTQTNKQILKNLIWSFKKNSAIVGDGQMGCCKTTIAGGAFFFAPSLKKNCNAPNQTWSPGNCP